MEVLGLINVILVLCFTKYMGEGWKKSGRGGNFFGKLIKGGWNSGWDRKRRLLK